MSNSTDVFHHGRLNIEVFSTGEGGVAADVVLDDEGAGGEWPMLAHYRLNADATAESEVAPGCEAEVAAAWAARGPYSPLEALHREAQRRAQ